MDQHQSGIFLNFALKDAQQKRRGDRLADKLFTIIETKGHIDSRILLLMQEVEKRHGLKANTSTGFLRMSEASAPALPYLRVSSSRTAYDFKMTF